MAGRLHPSATAPETGTPEFIYCRSTYYGAPSSPPRTVAMAAVRRPSLTAAIRQSGLGKMTVTPPSFGSGELELTPTVAIRQSGLGKTMATPPSFRFGELEPTSTAASSSRQQQGVLPIDGEIITCDAHNGKSEPPNGSTKRQGTLIRFNCNPSTVLIGPKLSRIRAREHNQCNK
ncbi:hypothetical protein ACLOJK_006414 [Asimina triloba]